MLGDLAKHKGTFKSFSMKGNEDWPTEIVLYPSADPSVDDEPVAVITADQISATKGKKGAEVKCPNCGKPVWDVATVDQALNKCWDCGTKWMNDPDDEPEVEASQRNVTFIRFHDPGYFYRNLNRYIEQNPSTNAK